MMKDQEKFNMMKGFIKGSNAKAIITVSLTIDFLVPNNDGYPLDELAKEWFEQFSLTQHHAFRDGNKIGYSEVISEYDIITVDPKTDKLEVKNHKISGD